MTRGLAALLILAALAAGARSALKPPPLRSGPGFSRAVYDRRGRLLRLTLSPDGKYRLWLPLSEISPKLLEATLLQEDRRFRYHPGADPASLLEAAWTTYGARGRRRGASTITMQLARLKYGMDSSRARGKLLQILRAFQLEWSFTKDEILEAYLNLLPYGGNIEGAGAGQPGLFLWDKDASRLDLSEAVTLAVIPQNPIRRTLTGAASADDSAREEARRRLFARWAAKHPDDARGGSFLEAPWRVRGAKALPFLAPHFARPDAGDVRRRAAGDDAWTWTPSVLLERLVERLAWRAARSRAIRNAAALLVDFTTMEVEAAVGSADFRDESIQGQVSALTAKRSPGSTLKPFVYGLAFEQGLIHQQTLLKDAPAAFGAYDPENFDGEFAGPISAREALIKSRNIPAVALDAQLKAPGLYGLLKDAGVDLPAPPEHYGLGLALGSGEVTMEDLARLYAALGNSGRSQNRCGRLARRSSRAAGHRLFSPEATFLVMDFAGKSNPRPHQNFREEWRANESAVYWKTGTSWAFRDAWSAGVFGRHVLIVWVGDFRGRGNPAFVGADAAAPLFFEIADALNARSPELDAYARAQKARLNVVPVVRSVRAVRRAARPRPASTRSRPGSSPARRRSRCATSIAESKWTRAPACARAAARTRVTKTFGVPGPATCCACSRSPASAAAAGLPADDPSCGLTSRSGRGLPPKITSPLTGATYRAAAADLRRTIALTAVADADVRSLWWFAWTQRPRRPLRRPAGPSSGPRALAGARSASWTIKARADAREVEVDFED